MQSDIALRIEVKILYGSDFFRNYKDCNEKPGPKETPKKKHNIYKYIYKVIQKINLAQSLIYN